MPTDAYAAFEKNINRAEALIRVFERGRTAGRPLTEDTTLPRASVVFSIGALDAYLHDLVLEVVGEFVPQSPTLANALKDMQPQNLVQTMARAATIEDARDSFRKTLDEHFDDKSFMDVSGLLRACNLVGCNTTVAQLAIDTNRPDLGTELGTYTNVRHRMLHRGENPKVLKDNAKKCAAMVRDIVNAVEAKVIAKHYGGGP